MTCILGIDAAWTSHNPSGVALIENISNGWFCRAVAPSYDSFLGIAEGKPVDWEDNFKGSMPRPAELLQASREILKGKKIDLVTIDMPIATKPIRNRRSSDQLVSVAFGQKGCSVHSPNTTRPGHLGSMLTAGFAWEGFSIATKDTKPGTLACLVEVYPHPAILTLLGTDYRIPYKTARTIQYWPDTTYDERRTRLLYHQNSILKALKRKIKGIGFKIPKAPETLPFSRLRCYENALDALVCAWVGARYCAGKITPYGDSTSAIWIPE